MSYRPDIDGLRALAVSLVVVFHLFPGAAPGGFYGVDVFFVISGYLITGIILREIAGGEFRFRRFYARRVRRLFPALFTVLAAVLALGSVVMFPVDLKALGVDTLASIFFVPNLLYGNEGGYFKVLAESKPLLHLWSLGVEEQFYLAWPLLLVITRAKYRIWILVILAALSFEYGIYLGKADPTMAFYSPLSRLWELGVGGVLAALGVERSGRELLSAAGLVVIAASAALLGSHPRFPGLWAALPVAGTAMVIAGGSRVLGRAPFVAIGRISYPIYLWHWPLFTLSSSLHGRGYPARLGLIAATLVLASLTYRFVEIPFQRGRWRQRLFPAAGAAMALAGCAGLVLFQAGGFPSRFSRQIRPVLTLMDYDYTAGTRYGECWLTEEPFARYRHRCRIGRVLVWGDSQAAMLSPGLRPVFGEVAQFTRSSCPPVLGAGSRSCMTSNRNIIEAIAGLHPDMVVLDAAWFDYEDYSDPDAGFLKSLATTLGHLRDDKIEHVVVLGPVPTWLPGLPAIAYDYWKNTGNLPDRLPPNPHPYRLADCALARVARAHGAQFVSLYDRLCDGHGCLTHTPAGRSDLLSWDYAHLTRAGADFVAGGIWSGSAPPAAARLAGGGCVAPVRPGGQEAPN